MVSNRWNVALAKADPQDRPFVKLPSQKGGRYLVSGKLLILLLPTIRADPQSIRNTIQNPRRPYTNMVDKSKMARRISIRPFILFISRGLVLCGSAYIGYITRRSGVQVFGSRWKYLWIGKSGFGRIDWKSRESVEESGR